jgi:hypothetical protein
MTKKTFLKVADILLKQFLFYDFVKFRVPQPQKSKKGQKSKFSEYILNFFQKLKPKVECLCLFDASCKTQ